MTMPEETGWPRLLQFLGHELRNSLTVIAGYPKIMLGGRGGPLTDMQRFMVGELDKVATRMLVLLTEISDVAAMESGRATFKSGTVDLRRVLSDAIAALPAEESYSAEIVLGTGDGAIQVTGDETRLRTAFTSLFRALRRELTDGNQLLVRSRAGQFRGRRAEWIAIGDPLRIAALEAATAETLTEFDEYRGGTGLSLAVARRVIDHHGGALWSPGQGTKAGAVVALPRS
jgi:signal transduction histidine kinase